MQSFRALLFERPFVQKFLGGVLAQGLVSVTSLILKVWVARATSKEQYGLYVLAFTTVLIFMNAQNALVSSPFTVLIPDKKEDEKRRFISGLGTGQWLFFVPAVLLFAAGGAVYGAATGRYAQAVWIFPLAFVVPAMLAREYTRVLNYADMDIGKVILTDVVFISSTVAGLLVLDFWSKLNGVNAVIVLGIGYLVSAVFGKAISGYRYEIDAGAIREAFGETWKYSRWALIGMICYNIQARGYVYLISSFLGLERTADISAAQLLLMPFGLLITSNQRIFLAKGSRVRSSGDTERFKRFILAYALFFVSVWVLYVGLLWVLHRRLILFIFTEKYLNITGLLPAAAVLYLLMSIGFVFSFSLQVFRDFKMLALFGLISAVVVPGLCLALISSIGAVGAFYALITGELLMLVCCATRLRSIIARQKNAVKQENGT